VGPRAGLDTEATGNILSPLPGIEPRSPGRPARSQILYWLSYPAFKNKIKSVNIMDRLNTELLNTVYTVGTVLWRVKRDYAQFPALFKLNYFEQTFLNGLFPLELNPQEETKRQQLKFTKLCNIWTKQQSVFFRFSVQQHIINNCTWQPARIRSKRIKERRACVWEQSARWWECLDIRKIK